jgi:site-specific recombinase XerD
MSTTDFARHLTAFFTEYLIGERGASSNTIRSYGETFCLLLNFMDEHEHIKADSLRLEHLNKRIVLDFLEWLQKNRGSGNTTRNQRLAAIRSFFSYMQYEDVKHLAQWQEILSIKVKKDERRSVNYLSIEGVKLLLEQIPTNTSKGRRDLALISLLYDSGARVQELIDLTPASLKTEKPYCITLFGKGRKKRIVPLQEEQIRLLQGYMEENRLDLPASNQRPLFANSCGRKLTNSGISYILDMYACQARILNTELIPEKISPHSLRHSKAMHLLQAGVNLVYIRDILGHVSIQTTEIYARADSKQKREALESAYVDIIPNDATSRSWEQDPQLQVWLNN